VPKGISTPRQLSSRLNPGAQGRVCHAVQCVRAFLQIREEVLNAPGECPLLGDAQLLFMALPASSAFPPFLYLTFFPLGVLSFPCALTRSGLGLFD
jgi:hypothetical protein